MYILLILAGTSFGMEIIMPLLDDQQTEQLASVSDSGDEDDSDEESKSEQEYANDDLFIDTSEPLNGIAFTESGKTSFGMYLFPIVTSHTDTPFSPPEMRM